MPTLAQYPFVVTIQKMARQKKIDIFLVGGFLRDCGLNPNFEFKIVSRRLPLHKKMKTKGGFNPDKHDQIPSGFDQSALRADFSIEKSGLNKNGHDFDFAMERGAVAFARAFAKTIRGAFVLLDQEHGCARVVKKSAAGIETFDFADFRASTLKGDLSHRDFTINTFSLKLNDLQTNDEFTDNIQDLCNGIKDLKARRLRMVRTATFKEDPLRLLRGYSLRAQLGFTIEPKTLARIKKDKSLLRNVARERILDEFFKVLLSPRAAENLRAMDRVGLLEGVIPQVAIMSGVKQGGYHHLDVWPHSLETVAQLEDVFIEYESDPGVKEYLDEPLAGKRSRRGLLKLAALLHDIGKPQTRKKEKDRMSFHGHEHVGKVISRAIAKMMMLSGRERMILEDIVLWHLRPGYLSNFKKPSDRAVFRYFRDTGEEAASVALLSIADQRSTRGSLSSKESEAHHVKICRGLIKKFFTDRKEQPFRRLIDGSDLIKELKLKPGPVFGKILRGVEEEQATGKIKTKEDALALARKIANLGPFTQNSLSAKTSAQKNKNKERVKKSPD